VKGKLFFLAIFLTFTSSIFAQSPSSFYKELGASHSATDFSCVAGGATSSDFAPSSKNVCSANLENSLGKEELYLRKIKKNMFEIIIGK
jgi:hypothetical protein